MILVDDKTDYQVQLIGLQILQKELGVGGLIRFLQQYDRGQGDYTKERHKWQKDITVDEISKSILKN
ncbi:MAG: hypothetical protein OEV44_14110 [Spirochaetota bacterium]|nr:hypothetical protein [Spirochaetota bacterium]